jgi:2-polyprenyl-6-methoxyphenol hydroxylase-like FAD-dependent oxidoreductase
MRIVIVGGGAAGLFAGLLLARANHEVAVLEQDHLEPAPDVETAARTSVPLDGAADRATAYCHGSLPPAAARPPT